MEWFKLFLHIVSNEQLSCYLQKKLKSVVKDEELSEHAISTNLLGQHNRWVRHNKHKTIRELHIEAQIVGYKIKDNMLDLGFDVKFFPWKTWEELGRPKLVSSQIQLFMANQYCILPIFHLEDVEVDIVGVNTEVDFVIINIIGDKDPYLALLGVY